MEADRIGLENPSWRFTPNGGGSKALRTLSLGCKSFTCSGWTSCSQQTKAPSAISCLRHMYECRLWLHLITMPFKLHLAHRDTAQVPVASLFTATFLPSSVLLLMKKLQTCRRKNEGLWIQGALDSKSCLIPPSSRNCCVILTISSLTC